jgi:hypothetical protein
MIHLNYSSADGQAFSELMDLLTQVLGIVLATDEGETNATDIFYGIILPVVMDVFSTGMVHLNNSSIAGHGLSDLLDLLTWVLEVC